MNIPKVTVLMAVYNGEKYLKESINSILKQTFTDFEFLIINDASTDNSVEIIQSFEDVRIRLVHNERNLGLTKSLNKGLSLCQGKYIARMDIDDTCYPQRLEKQVIFMDTHPETGVCGSWVDFVADGKSMGVWKYETNHEDLKIQLLYRNCIAHPSAMLRRSVLNKHQLTYNENFYTTQDYELWARMSNYCQLANLPEPLLKYRRQNESVSIKKKHLQKKNTHQVRLLQLNQINIFPSLSEFITHLKLIYEHPVTNAHALKERYNWLRKLWQANIVAQKYDHAKFQVFLSEQWNKSINSLPSLNVKIFFICLFSRFQYASGSKGKFIKFFLRCLIGSFNSAVTKLNA